MRTFWIQFFFPLHFVWNPNFIVKYRFSPFILFHNQGTPEIITQNSITLKFHGSPNPDLLICPDSLFTTLPDAGYEGQGKSMYCS